MATLTQDTPITYAIGDRQEYPVIADDIIYEGAAVGENASGYSRPLVAGDVFQGFSEAKADNDGGSAGDVNVRVKAKGYARLAISALAITANDKPQVFASDDNTFTLTSTSNSLIGHVSRWDGAGFAIVYFDADLAAAETLTLAAAIAADA